MTILFDVLGYVVCLRIGRRSVLDVVPGHYEPPTTQTTVVDNRTVRLSDD